MLRWRNTGFVLFQPFKDGWSKSLSEMKAFYNRVPCFAGVEPWAAPSPLLMFTALCLFWHCFQSNYKESGIELNVVWLKSDPLPIFPWDFNRDMVLQLFLLFPKNFTKLLSFVRTHYLSTLLNEWRGCFNHRHTYHHALQSDELLDTGNETSQSDITLLLKNWFRYLPIFMTSLVNAVGVQPVGVSRLTHNTH